MRFLRRASALSLVAIAFSPFSKATAANTARPQQVTVDPVKQVIVVKGKPAKAEIHLHVNNGFHINSNKPTSDLLIPTTVELVPDSHVKIGEIEYPAGKDFTISAAPDEKLNVYAGSVNIFAPIVAAKTTVPGTYSVKGTLTYQACSDNACFPPKKVPLEFSVKVKGATGK